MKIFWREPSPSWWMVRPIAARVLWIHGPMLTSPAVVMPELVREHRLELLHGQRLHQRQADAHDPPAAEAHHAAALRHERVHVIDQIHMRGHRLLGGRRHAVQHLEQLRRIGGAQRRARRDKTIDARQHRPDDGAGKSHTDQGELDRQPHVVGVGLVGNPQERSGDAERERIEAHHQQHRERGTLHQPGCLFHCGPLASGPVGRPALHRDSNPPWMGSFGLPNAEIVPPKSAAPSRQRRARRAQKSSTGPAHPSRTVTPPA